MVSRCDNTISRSRRKKKNLVKQMNRWMLGKQNQQNKQTFGRKIFKLNMKQKK